MLTTINSYHILKKVILEQGHCNVLIAQMMQNDNYQLAQKELIETLVNETLKHQIYLDYILSNLAKLFEWEDNPHFTLENRIFCWLILYQIYFQKQPISTFFQNETNKLCEKINPEWTVMITAMLLYLKANPLTQFHLEQEKPLTKKLIKHSYPESLYQLIAKQYSVDVAHQLMKDNLVRPLISFRVNTLKANVNDILKDKQYTNFHFHSSKLVKDGLISDKTIFTTDLYRSGKIIKQDQASMLVSHVVDPLPADIIWDMCGGIGAKTAHLAALLNNQSQIYVTEIDLERIKLAKQYLAKLNVQNVIMLHQDARKSEWNQQFDKILLDAPSTAFGLIKRKPELKLITWTNTEINEIFTLQSELLTKAYQSLKSNGILVYVTCTFNLLENQKQIEMFMQKYPDMLLMEEHQIFGVQEQSDGFYICKLKKIEGNENENNS